MFVCHAICMKAWNNTQFQEPVRTLQYLSLPWLLLSSFRPLSDESFRLWSGNSWSLIFNLQSAFPRSFSPLLIVSHPPLMTNVKWGLCTESPCGTCVSLSYDSCRTIRCLEKVPVFLPWQPTSLNRSTTRLCHSKKLLPPPSPSFATNLASPFSQTK